MQIYDFETLFRDMPEKLEDATHEILSYNTETRTTLCVNNVEIYCDDTKLEYISVGHFGPTINIYFLEKDEVVAMHFMHVDDNMIVDGKDICFYDFTSEKTMLEMAKSINDKLDEVDKTEDRDKWLQERRNVALTAIREHKERKESERSKSNDKGVFSSAAKFEEFMEETIKATIKDTLKPKITICRISSDETQKPLDK